MSYWAIAQTEPQREHIARLWIMRLGFETYAPRVRLRRGKIARLFPTYIFVRIALDRWYPVLWSPGVLRLLMSGDKPFPLPDKEITAIKRREVGGFVRLPRRVHRPGEQVKIVAGQLEGQLALYEGMSSTDRENVLLEFLGRKVRVELPTSHISPPLNVASAPDLSY